MIGVAAVARAEDGPGTPPPRPSPSPAAIGGTAPAATGEAADEAPAAPPTVAPAPAPQQRPPAPAGEGAESGEITVLGRNRDDPRIVGSAQVVTERQLKVFSHTDANRVLRNVPGVYVRDEDGFGLRPNIGLRGASSDRSAKVTLMEDGVLFGPAPYAAPAAYYFPMMQRIVGVEVFKGSASVRSGPQTIGGAINLVTRDVPRRLEGAVDAAAGNYGTIRLGARAGIGNDDFGVLLEAVRLQTDGFKRLDDRAPTGFTKNEAVLKARGAFGGLFRHEFDLKLMYGDEVSRETYLGLTDAEFRKSPLRRLPASQNDVMRWRRTAAAASHTFTWGDTLELRTTVYRHDLHRRWDRLDAFRGGPGLGDVLANPTGLNAVYAAVLAGEIDGETREQQLTLVGNDRRFYSQGVQSQGTARFDTGPARHGLRFGVRVHNDQIRRDHDAGWFEMRSARLIPSGDPRFFTTRNTGTVLATALHALDEIDIGPVTLAPGVRYEMIAMRFRDRMTGERRSSISHVVLPGLGMAWQAHPMLTAIAGVHRGFSPVAPGQDAGVRPEDSINVEAGLRFRYNGMRLEAIGFYNRYANIVGTCTSSNGCPDAAFGNQYNGGRADVAGLEFAFGRRDVVKGYTLDYGVNYTYTSARFASSFASAFPQFGNVRRGDALPYVPEHQGFASFGVESKWWRFTLGANYVGPMRDIAGQGPIPANRRTDHQITLDAAAGVRLGGGAEITLTGTNLTNASYIVSRRPYGIRPNMPIAVLAGLRWEGPAE